MEIITGIERRRRWRDEDKLRIVGEAEQLGCMFRGRSTATQDQPRFVMELAAAGPARRVGFGCGADFHAAADHRGASAESAAVTDNALVASHGGSFPH